MEKYAWRAKLKKGCREEYERRHNEIWQRMKDVLTEAGIVNYTIWLDGEDLFGYYECTQGVAHAAAVQANSPIVDEWNEYMRDILDMTLDPQTGAQPHLECVFAFDGKR